MNESPAAASTEPPHERAPTWRSKPYRLFFPLGLLHAWAGVLPWLLLSIGVLEHNMRVYHSITQIQGFLICFAVGFLFTMVPRRTRTDAPSALQMVVALVSPVGATVCAACDKLAWSQMFWFALAAVMLTFVVGRFRRSSAERGAPPGFVWVPIGVAMGVVGSAMFAAYGMLGPEYFHVHELAGLFLLQGLFLSLVLGVGSMVLPLFTCGEGPGGAAPGDRRRRVLHLLAAVLLVGTFFLEVFGLPFAAETVGALGGRTVVGYATRAVVVLAVLLWAGKIYRLPRLPGANRLLVWGTAWMLPIGYVLAACFPLQRQAGLHVVFIGGLAPMAFAVGMHVILAHGGKKHLVGEWPWQVVGYGGLFFVAVVTRALAEFELERVDLWRGVAAGAFLLATVSWSLLAVPALVRPRG